MRLSLYLVVLLASLALIQASPGASESVGEGSLDPITIPFEEAVMEPTGQHLRLRWRQTDFNHAFGDGWKFWERPGTFNPLSGTNFVLSTGISNRTRTDLNFGNSVPLPDAGSVRVQYDDGDITIDAYIEVKGGTDNVLYPGETAHVTVAQGFIRAYTAVGQPETAVYVTAAINNEQIDTSLIGAVPYTDLFGDSTPQAALWCEAGAQDVYDPDTPTWIEEWQDRSGRTNLLVSEEYHRPKFAAASTFDSRFGDDRATVLFNHEGAGPQFMTTDASNDFNHVDQEMLVAVCFQPKANESSSPPAMHIVTKRRENGVSNDISWYIGWNAAGKAVFGTYNGNAQQTIAEWEIDELPRPQEEEEERRYIIIVRTSAEAPETDDPVYFVKIEAWLNGKYILLTPDPTISVYNPMVNGLGPIIVGAKDGEGNAPFKGYINEVFFAPGPSTLASVACLIHEMHQRWGERIEDTVVSPGTDPENYPEPEQPERTPERKPLAEINLFGGHYKKGDYLTGQHEMWYDHGQGHEDITEWLDGQFAAIKYAEDYSEENVMDVVLRLPGGKLAGENMNSDGLGWITEDQKTALVNFIDNAREGEDNEGEESFTGEDPPRLLWVYTGSGLPFDYGDNTYGFNEAHDRVLTKSVMQNRVMAPAIAADWRTEIALRYTQIHPKLLHYLADAAAKHLTLERYIGVAHDEAFNEDHLIILEPLIEDPEPFYYDLRQFVPLYSSLHFGKAPWWTTGASPEHVRWQCNGFPDYDKYFLYYANGGEQLVDTECPNPDTEESDKYWMDEDGVRRMHHHGSNPVINNWYIPIGKPGEDPNEIPFYKHTYDGWVWP